MALKKLEYILTDNEGRIGLGGVPFRNSDFGDFSNQIKDTMSVLAGNYGNSNRYIQTKYNFSDVFVSSTTFKNRFQDLKNHIDNTVLAGYGINANSAIGTFRSGTGLSTSYNPLTQRGLMDAEVKSGFDIDVDFDDNTNVFSITLKKGAIGAGGYLWLNDGDMTFTHTIVNNSTVTTSINLDTNNITITPDTRNRKNNQPIDVREIIETNISVGTANVINTPKDPIWNESQNDNRVNKIPLVVFITTLSGNDLTYRLILATEDYRQSNETLFLRRELRENGIIDNTTII